MRHFQTQVFLLFCRSLDDINIYLTLCRFFPIPLYREEAILILFDFIKSIKVPPIYAIPPHGGS